MGWERRGNGLYYYRKERSGGRVVSRYAGSGEVGQAIAQLQESDTAMWQALREQEQRERETERQLEQQGRELESLCRALVAAHLLTAGYHTHKGQWRARRNG